MNYKFIVCFTALLWLSGLKAIAQKSVLADGEIWKLKIKNFGVHQVTYQDLRDAGADLSSISPENIQVFGFGGGMLPQANIVSRPESLTEQAIWVGGAADGSFDEGDYILFYAQGADSYGYDEEENSFFYEKNLYDEFNYYFLKIGLEQGKRITVDNNTPSGRIINSFPEILHHELEDNNVLANLPNSNGGGSGRKWFGEKFDFQTDYNINFDTEGMASSSTTLTAIVSAMALSSVPSRFNVTANGENLGDISVPTSRISTYAKKGHMVKSSLVKSVSSDNQTTIGINYNKNSSEAFGYLDYITLVFEKKLRFYEQNTHFRYRSANENENVRFEFENLDENVRVWQLSPSGDVSELSANGNAFGANISGAITELVAFDESQTLPAPLEINPLENQNLRGLTTPEYLIITHTDFLEAANTLAAFHAQQDGLVSTVITIDKIWNEFASGRKDVSAIRDFVRHLYLKNPERLRYLLLFGDTSYDYKDRINGNDNYIPIYMSRESLHPVQTFSSEDFFGLLDENEGSWLENSEGNKEDLDIGIGRIPVRSAEQAEQVVQKIISYTLPQTLGKWRNKVVFLADDGDANIHLRDSENLVRILEDYKEYEINKLYIDAYPQISTSDGKLSPQVRQELDEFVNEGALIINYMGHGSESSLASESVVDLSSLARWSNPQNLPLFVTATCEFGRYDNPQVYSVGERLINREKNGAIALVTTTRPVTASTNYVLARALYNTVFEPLSDGLMPRLGDVIRQTKNQSLAVVNRNFTLLGDPALRLNYPKETISINRVETNGSPSTLLRALDRVNIKGQVGNTADFDGELEIIVYDKPIMLRTLGDESSPVDYESFENVIYRGKAEVLSGNFEFDFVVPQDINYTIEEGRMLLYAHHKNLNRDADGYLEIEIGASNPNAEIDNQAPEVRLFIENRDFISGDDVPSNTVLIADISDENGINLTGFGVGREITATIDGNTEQTFLLNDYFIYEKGNSKNGTIVFPLRDLNAGEHTLELTVWDTYNNPTTAQTTFYVENQPIQIEELRVFPNPSPNIFNFNISHNRAGDDLEVGVVVYDVTGRAIKTIRKSYLNANNLLENLSWNGRGNDGNLVANGVYICKVYVHSLSDDKVGEYSARVVVGR